MANRIENIDEETINKIGLHQSDKAINAQISPTARIFEYPNLENVFVMESDLYGNVMPKGYCFLVFGGNHGLIGKQVKLETLRNATSEEVRNMVQNNVDG